MNPKRDIYRSPRKGKEIRSADKIGSMGFGGEERAEGEDERRRGVEGELDRVG